MADILPVQGYCEEQLLETAALVEQFSSHPIARSILDAWGKTPDASRVSDMKEHAGEGVLACLDGVPVAVGNMRRGDLAAIFD